MKTKRKQETGKRQMRKRQQQKDKSDKKAYNMNKQIKQKYIQLTRPQMVERYGESESREQSRSQTEKKTGRLRHG